MSDSINFYSNPYFGYSATFVYFSLFSVNLLCCEGCTFYCPLKKKRYNLLPEGTDLHIWPYIHQID